MMKRFLAFQVLVELSVTVMGQVVIRVKVGKQAQDIS